MTKILDKYIIKKFIINFLFIITSFIVIFLIVDIIDNLDKFIGGKYLITDLCHRMDSTGVFTKLNLQRDKFKRGSVNRGPL